MIQIKDKETPEGKRSMEEAQRKQKTTGRKSPWRFAFAALALYAGVELLLCLAAWLIGNVFGGISFNVTKASTIGIIGGADGPTSVFVTAAPAPAWHPFLMLVLLAAGVWGFRRLNRCKQE